MRCQRVRISISVCSSMCPMCSEPVTLGGGITMENTGPGAFTSARNSCSLTQNSAQRGSINCGSYAFAISRGIRPKAPGNSASLHQYAAHFAFRSIFDYTSGSEHRQLDEDEKNPNRESIYRLNFPAVRLSQRKRR